ncbi:MAG: 30S ribosomal protein S20 [Myxococcales bacterium]|nr:30S ribosomal protein S20 [Myxococcales bacterium]USN50704.1 MAG: 30S ribosomal protein S20 [Myxococcales bacterium]
MANHASALKRHRQSLKRNARNRSARAALATQLKKARQEISNKTAKVNEGEIQKAVSSLAVAVRKGILHKKAAARRTSRLMRQANACAA